MNNCKTIELNDVCNNITVGFVGSMVDEYVDEGVLFLRSQNILPFNLNLDAKQIKFISKDFDKKISKSKLYPGNIAIVRTGYPGTACVIPEGFEDLNCSDLVIVRPDNSKIDSNYLCNYINSPMGRGAIFGSLVGVAQQHFNVGVAKKMKISLPSLKTQQKISSILSSYDELIENNKQRIKLLEEMAEEIYKEWFVRLRFPGYENTKIVDGLPEDWQNSVIGELTEFKKGKNITLDTVTDGNIPVVAGGLSPAYYHNAANTISPTITISASGANAGFVNLYFENIWASDCSYLDSKSTDVLFYMYLTLKTRQNEVFFLQKGSAQPHVYPKDIMTLKLLKPSKELIEQFENLITPFFEEIKLLSQKNQLLQETRDLLLPRLISGKLSVEHLINEEELLMVAEPNEAYKKY